MKKTDIYSRSSAEEQQPSMDKGIIWFDSKVHHHKLWVAGSNPAGNAKLLMKYSINGFDAKAIESEAE